MKRTAVPLFVGLLLLVAAFGVASGQASPNFDLRISSLGGGGGTTQSTNFAIESTMGQALAGVTSAATTQLASGYIAQAGGVQQFLSDAFEADDACPVDSADADAKPDGVEIVVDGAVQSHSSHREGDQDWVFFMAQANKTYVIELKNIGPKSNAVIALYGDCASLGDTGTGSFGTTVRLEWNSTRNGPYLVQFQQYDATQYGTPADTRFDVSVKVDQTPPPKPTNARCEAKNANTIGVQWDKSTDRGVVSYAVQYSGNVSGVKDADGRNTTYAEVGSLSAGQAYSFRVKAVDYSGNESQPTSEFQCVAQQPVDTTAPAFDISQPNGSPVVTTTATKMTFTGSANDSGNNLSRAKVVVPQASVEKFDNSLSGGSDSFRVEDVPLAIGDNSVAVSVEDAAGNKTTKTITVKRLGTSPGAVIIIAGHNESFGLQANIYFSANRAVRIFKQAGYPDDAIFYLAPVNQDADNDGVNDVDLISSPASIQNVITNLVKSKVGAGKPLFMYWIDHGFTEKFCAAGCSTGAVTPKQVDGWLDTLESQTGLDEVNIVMEACQSGSFIDATEDAASSLSKPKRVIITSTGRTNNAYASAQGAYFSDAFFSCLVDSNDLKVCFDEGNAAVLAAGVAQTPWLDDNGDSLFNFVNDSLPKDGAVAKTRIVTQNFSSNRPVIINTKLTRQGADGVLSATVDEGAEEIDVVYATVIPPGFQAPTDVTLNLDVPTVRLDPKPGTTNQYEFTYVGGFPLDGAYNIQFYVQDVKGIGATPRPANFSAEFKVLLPTVSR
jgi:hypothetical protein